MMAHELPLEICDQTLTGTHMCVRAGVSDDNGQSLRYICVPLWISVGPAHRTLDFITRFSSILSSKIVISSLVQMKKLRVREKDWLSQDDAVTKLPCWSLNLHLLNPGLVISSPTHEVEAQGTLATPMIL